MSSNGGKSDERLRGWLAIALVAVGGFYAASESYNAGRTQDAVRTERINRNASDVAELRAEVKALTERLTKIEATIGSSRRRR